jgi:DNA-directed RNA polymerase beta' subunit
LRAQKKPSQQIIQRSSLAGRKRISKNFYPVHNVKSFLKNVSIPFYLFSHFSYFPELEENQKETKIKKRIKNKTKTKIKNKHLKFRKLNFNKDKITASRSLIWEEKEEIIKNLENKSKKAIKKIYTTLITNLIKKKNCVPLELNDILKQKQLITKTRLAALTIKNKIKKTKVIRNQILKETYKMILNQIIYKKNLIFWKLIQTTKSLLHLPEMISGCPTEISSSRDLLAEMTWPQNKFFTKSLNIDKSNIVFMPDYRNAIATQNINQNCGAHLFKSCTLSPTQLFYLGFKNLRVLRKINSNISLKKEFEFIKKKQSNLMGEKEFFLGGSTNTNQFNRPFLMAKPLKKDTQVHQLNFLLAKNCFQRIEAAYSFFYYFCCRSLDVTASREDQANQNKKLIDYSPQSLSLLRNNKSLNLKKLKLNYLMSRWVKKTKIINKFTKKLPGKIIQFFLTAILKNRNRDKMPSRGLYLCFCFFEQQQHGFTKQSIGQVANKKKNLKQNTVDILSKNKISKVNFSNLKTNHLKNELSFKKKIFLLHKLTLERKKTIIYFLKKIIFLTVKNQIIINYKDSMITSSSLSADLLPLKTGLNTFYLNKNKSISQLLSFNLINFYTNFFKILDYEGNPKFISDLTIKNYAPHLCQIIQRSSLAGSRRDLPASFFNDLAIKKDQLKKLIKKNSFDFLFTLNFGLLLSLFFKNKKNKLKMFLSDPQYSENSKCLKEKKQLFAFSSLIKKFNKKRVVSSQLDSNSRGQMQQKKIINTIYTLSYRERWETDQDWNIFRLYNIPCINFLDIVNPFYEETSWHSNKDYISFSKLFFQPLITSNYFPIYQKINNSISSWKKENLIKKDSSNTILEKCLITATAEEQNFQYNHRTAVFSGPGLINNLLREFNFDELTKMDLQNRFILFILNRKIVTVKNNFSKCYDSKDEKLVFKELKELYKKRELLIRRTKLVRQFNKNVSNPTLMMIHLLPVLPPDLRPIIKIGNQIAASDLNRLYQRVIYRNDRLKKFLIDSPTSSSYEIKYVQRLLQEAVDNLISNGKSGVTPEKDSRGRLLKSLSDTLKGKQGRFRQYLLGKRIDYSGRSVIVVGPTLKIHECGIPKEMAFELYLPFLLKNILNQKLTRTVIGAKTLIKKNPTLAWEVLKELMQTSPVLLNRAPTLHRLGIQAFQPKLVEGRAILLHPLVCSAFNADFDGDQMAVHIPITVEARSEAWKLMLSRNNLLAPSTGEPLAIPSQDMVLGCYYLTTNCSDKNLQYQKGSGSYFLTFLDIIKNYETKKLDLHSIIWLKWHDWIENGNDHEEPLEIRINSYGDFKEIYAKSQNHYDKKKVLISQYVSTTPGKVIFNQMIRKSLNLF